jgi:hypothetical protein
MSTPTTLPTAEELIASLDRNGGNKSAMALELGVHRETIRKLMRTMGLGNRPISGGITRPEETVKLPLPRKAKVSRYLLTCAQNNTHVFDKFLDNLKAYQAWLRKTERMPVPIMVSRYTYNKSAFDNSFLSKPGRGPTDADHDNLWYDPKLDEYVCDDPEEHGSAHYELAPGLHWCAEMNIKPTATRPLSDLDTYAGNNSAIFPHTKVALQSMPRMKNEKPRFLYTTGTVTKLNYIQRKEGLKATHHHVYGALLVEVDHRGNWWARQINADRHGSFYDCPRGNVVKVSDGKVTEGHSTEAVNWGDAHASQIKTNIVDVNWGAGGVIDKLKPRCQFWNDLLSFHSQNHHDRKKFGVRYRKFIQGQDSVHKEIISTRDFLKRAHRDWCLSVVVNSNHDRHGERWLDEADFKADLPNARFFIEAQRARIIAIEDGNDKWQFIEWALQHVGCPTLRFLQKDESFLIGPRAHPVECGLHGDLGVNGARGSTRSISRLGHRANKGHDHSATIDGPTYSAGVCELDLEYNEGLTTWSISHVLTYLNGKRAVLSQCVEKLWA